MPHFTDISAATPLQPLSVVPPCTPRLDREVRVEANKDLPSCKHNPSTLHRRRKPLAEQVEELKIKRKEEARHRRKNWTCCKRVYHWAATGIGSTTESCGESIKWALRGACSCTCSCSMWKSPLRLVEGYLGSHVSTYFRALVWLLKINLTCMVLGLGLIVFPGVYLKSYSENETTLYNKDGACWDTDIIPGEGQTIKNINNILHLFTGTGWMEDSPVFIGWYLRGNLGSLPLPFVYSGVVVAYFLLSLVVISSNVSRLFNRSAVEALELKPYSDLVFRGWDFSIESGKLAQLKMVTIQKSMREQLVKDSQRARRRTLLQSVCVAVWRVITNLLCLSAMAGFFYALIKYGNILNSTVSTTCKLQGIQESSAYSKLSELWTTYSASIIMAIGNTAYPLMFSLVGAVEFYKVESNRVVITMVRSLVMKLATICTLLFLMYREVESSASVRTDEVGEIGYSVSDLHCWENHMAGKIYQLWVVHYFVSWGYTLIKKVLRVVGRQLFKVDRGGFDITEEILDLCYKQMIVWSLFPIAPLMTVVAVLETVATFYFKKWVAMSGTSRSHTRLVLTSHTANVINTMFLLSLLAIFTFYGVLSSNFAPSAGCGPFRGFPSFGALFTEMTASFGDVQTLVMSTLRSITATIIIIIVFSVGLYYYKCSGDSKDVKIRLLEERVRMEQRDKAYLLTKVCRNSTIGRARSMGNVDQISSADA